MPKVTLAMLEARCAALESGLAARDAEIVALKAEAARVQKAFASTQRFYTELKRKFSAGAHERVVSTAAVPPISMRVPYKERCLNYMAATGKRSVTMPELQAWERSQS